MELLHTLVAYNAYKYAILSLLATRIVTKQDKEINLVELLLKADFCGRLRLTKICVDDP